MLSSLLILIRFERPCARPPESSVRGTRVANDVEGGWLRLGRNCSGFWEEVNVHLWHKWFVDMGVVAALR